MDEKSSRQDLTEQVTVFVLTTGGPSFDACMRRVRAQDCKFRLQVIRDVAPMSAALQVMLDSCQTPYFVQVDEDMLLYPHAVSRLHTKMIALPSPVAIYTSHLFDAHPARLIYGLKIYRSQIVKKYPYRNVGACEWDQIRRFEADGYVDQRVPIEDPENESESTLGVHDPHWTPLSIFERYKNLETKRRRHADAKAVSSVHWVRQYAGIFLERFLSDGDDLDFYALMGVMAGTLEPIEGVGREKDFRTYDRIQGFAHARRFLQEAKTLNH